VLYCTYIYISSTLTAVAPQKQQSPFLAFYRLIAPAGCVTTKPYDTRVVASVMSQVNRQRVNASRPLRLYMVKLDVLSTLRIESVGVAQRRQKLKSSRLGAVAWRRQLWQNSLASVEMPDTVHVLTFMTTILA
jgi:hypothetical protein